MDERIELLANYLGEDAENITQSEYDDNVFVTNMGEEYLVVTEGEAYDLAKDDVLNLFDELGLESFTDYAQDYIINNFVDTEWFEDALREMEEYYVEDIKSESASSDEYETRLEEEMADAGVDNEDDFVEWLIEQAGDPVEYYKFNFGDKEFSRVVKANNLIDEDAMAEWVVDEDGPANSLARYDGREIDLDGNYFAYRQN